MDDIEEFEVHVDIDERQYLHDYVSGERLIRPEKGGWNMVELNERGRVDEKLKEEDENAVIKVISMDKSFEDTRLLEKGKKEDDKKEKKKDGDLSDEFTALVFEKRTETEGAPRRVIPVFKAGETVTGKLVLKLKKDMKASGLVLKFDGAAVVTVRVYHQYGCADIKKDESFVSNEIQLWNKKGNDDYIPAGTHRYPFQFILPENAPQSCPPLIPSASCWKGDQGFLSYRIKATIQKDKTFRSGDIATHQGIWVDGDCDLANFPETQQPVTVEEKLEAGALQFWRSGDFSVRASLSRSGFLRGESIPLRLEIDNKTKSDIKQVTARIKLYGKVQHGESKLSLRKSVNVKAEKMKVGPISAGECPRFDWNLSWDFSQSSVDSFLLPVGDLDRSVFIDVNYEVDINVKRSGLHRNVDLHIPLKIGSINSRDVKGMYPQLK